MGLFAEVNADTHSRNLEFLVIGGLAVIFQGYARDTADLELLIRRRERVGWLELLQLLGFSVQHNHENILQLAPPQAGA